MFLKKKTKEPETPKVIHLKRFQPFFTTVDGIQHEGPDFYNWINADGLRRAAPEYMMEDMINDGYLIDMNGIMYPIQNIMSIQWKLIGEKVVLDNFYHEYQIYFNNEEVSKMTEYDGG